LKPFTSAWERISLAWRARIAAALLVVSLLGAIYLTSARLIASRPTLLEFQVLVVLCALGMISFTPMREIFYRHFAWTQARQRVQAETQFLAYLLNILEQAVIVTDPKGRITFWNPHAAKLFGLSASEAQGQPALELLLGEAGKAQVQEIRSAVKSGHIWSGELTAQRHDGKEFPIQLTYTPFFDEQDQLVGMVATPVDIHDRRTREEQAAARLQLSRVLRCAITYDEMAPLIVEQVMQLMHTDGAALAQFNPAAREMLVERGAGNLAHWSGLHWILNDAPVDSAENTVQRGFFDLAELRAVSPRLFTGLNSVAAFTLGMPGEILGILAITRSNDITVDDLGVLSAIADTITHAIHRASLQEKIGQQKAQIASIASITHTLADSCDPQQIYERLTRATFDLLEDIFSVSIYHYDPNTELIWNVYSVAGHEIEDNTLSRPVALDASGSGLTREVIRSGKARIYNELQKALKRKRAKIPVDPGQPSPQSALFVPLFSMNQVTGVIQIQSYTLNRFEPGDLNILSYVAGAAALALENAHLRQLLSDP